MPFGLTNASSTFQSLMNEVFLPSLHNFLLVFYGYILVYSKSLQDHLHHLRSSLQLLGQHNLYAKESKCIFGTKEVQYLGHILSENGVTVDPQKIQVLNWPTPTSLKSLREFLGFTGYYRKFHKEL